MKSNRIYQILAIIMIVSLSAVILFMPDLIEQKYPWTYQNIQDKKNELISVSETLSSNEREIEYSKQNLQDLEKREEEAAEDVFQLKKGMKGSDFQIDIPSFLITLEQKAYEGEVELLIGYNSLTTTKNTTSQETPILDENGIPVEPPVEGEPDDYQSEQGSPQENGVPETTPEGAEVNTTEGIEVNESTTEAESSKDGENKEEDKGPEINNNVEIPTIDSIDVTTIPIEIKGTFFKVRDYLKFLDELGLIEPSSIKMTTNGLEVTAEITLNIFHGEGWDNIE